MSDCRFGASPVNYPDPDPDPNRKLQQKCLIFKNWRETKMKNLRDELAAGIQLPTVLVYMKFQPSRPHNFRENADENFNA